MQQRDRSIDVLRGLAVIVMVLANMAPLLPSPHPYWLRFIGSLAAPTFITLFGVMMARNYVNGKWDTKKILQRSLMLILLGSVIEFICLQVAPVVSMDVLYLIGMAGVGVLIFALLSDVQQLAAILFILGVTAVLQWEFGYPPQLLELYLFKDVAWSWPEIMKNIFVSGWFPLFPWLAYAFFGFLLGKYRYALSKKEISFVKDRWLLIISLLYMVLGFVFNSIYPSSEYEREGFCELFYPVSLGFVFFTWGFIPFMLRLVDGVDARKFPWTYANLFGRHSLPIYAAHLVIIRWVFRQFLNPPFSFTRYFICYAALMVVLGGLAFFYPRFKNKVFSPRPLVDPSFDLQ